MAKKKNSMKMVADESAISGIKEPSKPRSDETEASYVARTYKHYTDLGLDEDEARMIAANSFDEYNAEEA